MTLRWEDIFTEAVAIEVTDRFEDGRTKTGTMRFANREVPIRDGVPRFVPTDDYSKNFGIQWNKFRQTQLDSFTKIPLTFNRFWNNTKWRPKDLYGKNILEVGSGAGRFTEILMDSGANVVSFDLSSAVDANFDANSRKGNLLLFQASIYDMPVKDNFFDYVFCYGVLQHTPDPDLSYKKIFEKLKPGGRISIDYYLKTNVPQPWSTPKYFWRPLATKQDPQKLLNFISAYIPFWLPIDTFIKRIPKIGNTLGALTFIPCWNYYSLPLSYAQKKEWAIMDTFDALGAAYDYPKTLDEVAQLVKSFDVDEVDVFYGSNGVVANARKIK